MEFPIWMMIGGAALLSLVGVVYLFTRLSGGAKKLQKTP